MIKWLVIGMKAYVILVMMLAMTISTIADAHAAAGSTVPPKDQPNYHSKITKVKIDGKNLEIVEFQCKLAK
ncbi:MAG: hypothetical protein EPO62_04370 [Candidatus Nitrosotenuis sp.]|nr:MAG: hypothetical protein EPO62_04370 [Candidatus Nitrosotenuis sp.]